MMTKKEQRKKIVTVNVSWAVVCFFCFILFLVSKQNYNRMQYFTLPHLLCRTLVNLTSKLPNTSFWTTLDARVWWSPLDSTRLQQLNHCCRLGLGLGVRQVYIYCGWQSWQLSELSPPGFHQTLPKKKMSHYVTPSFSEFLSLPESARVHQIPPYSTEECTVL